MTRKFLFLCILFGLTGCFSGLNAQCFQIESILVDACGPQEGLNEMVRLRIGASPVTLSTLNVDWPNNTWQGYVMNATTASKVATLNADILDAGGCGQLIEPLGGTLPANSTVILVTSYLLDTTQNQFGPITEDIYIIFQDNPDVTGGHFANSGTGLRTLAIDFGSCSDTVTYDRAQLVNETGGTSAADGATVLFSDAGTATYINNGCSAPVPLFTADAGGDQSACAGTTITLSGSASGGQTFAWTAPSGTFANASQLSTTYTLDASATAPITLTLTVTNVCGATVTDTVVISPTASVSPDFPTNLQLCEGSSAPSLNSTSPNGISGTWSPATVSNTTSGSYVFTPNPGQCAASQTISVTVNPLLVPDFPTSLAVCSGGTVPSLSMTSPNGVSGTWTPSVISNTTGGSYVFIPANSQCATSVTLNVTVGSGLVPDFETSLTFCEGSEVPVLSSTSPNGVSGTWSPSAISNASSGTYVFTPGAGSCAQPVTLTVTINTPVVPDFETQRTICQNSEVPVLETTSPNGVTGSWTPATISNTQNGSYLFTPDPGQCAQSVTLNVTVSTISVTISQYCGNGHSFVAAGDSLVQAEWFFNGDSVSSDLVFDVSAWVSSQPSVQLPVTFTVQGTDETGCSGTGQITVSQVVCDIPKGVSVNGDGRNDSWNLSGLDVAEVQLFNRYGSRVYHQTDYTDQWHGQADSGQELPDATYYYMIRTYSGEQRSGWVYLIRKG